MNRIILRIIAAVICLIIAIPAFTFASGADGSLPFTDVKTGDWFYEHVKYVFDNGIMKGMTDKTFEPGTPVTRAMFVTMLGRLWGVEEKITNAFSDVSAATGGWYAGYVGWASENKIVSGFPDKTFRPNDPITREQMATVISRFLDFSGIIPLKSYDPVSYFKDEQKTSDYAVSHVDTMRMLGIITGNSDGTFNPRGKLTRAQAATVMGRLDKMLKSLALGEQNNPDFKSSSGDFYLLGAWDLYYSGTALGTNYEGVGVTEDDPVPYLSEDENGLTFYYAQRGDNTYGIGLARRTDPNELATPDSFSIDAVMDRIDLADYPVIRVGYSVPEGCSSSFAVFSEDRYEHYVAGSGGHEVEMTAGVEDGGWQYGIVDLTGSDTFDAGSLRVSLTLNASGALKVRYFAAFPDKASAEAFDLQAHAAELSSFDGEVVEVPDATESELDSAYAAANAKSDGIINSASQYTEKDVKGTCYYISSINGDDKNDGKSPRTAWKSFVNLYKVWQNGIVVTSNVKAGDGVFLERGSVFRQYAAGDYDYLKLAHGVIYGAYGSGEKPLITNSFDLGSPAGKWVSTEWDNVWRLDADISDMPGNIVFKKGDMESWGIFVMTTDPGNPFSGEKSVPYGWVSNGEESFESGGVTFSSPGSLCHNLEYIGDIENGGLWLYCDKGNPGEIYDELIISRSGDLVKYEGESLSTTMPTRLDNVAIKYTGGGGFFMFDAENVYVTNCVFEWIGGQYQGYKDDNVRFGNAVQNWGSCDGVVITDCYFKDIYDAAVTTQGRNGVMRNFYSSGCVLERCDLSYEFFNDGNDGKSELVNLYLTDNYVIDNGIGFCDVRTDRRSGFLWTSYGLYPTLVENFHYERNVNILSTEFAVIAHNVAFGQTAGLILKDNTYFMDPDASFYMSTVYNMLDRNGYTATFIPFTSQYLTYLNALGCETGSAFRTIKNPSREP